MILMDDNFASIVVGIREGRAVFDNLAKTIAYTLTHLWPEVVPVMLNLAVSMPLGLSSIQILSIDLATEMAPAISLAYEPSESDIMRRRPRRVGKDRLVSRPLLGYAYLQAGVLEALVCIGAYLWVFQDYGVPLSSLPFSQDYWKSDAANLTLPDGRVLTAADQMDVLAHVQSAWMFTLVASQFWHIWSCKTRAVSLAAHGLFSNRAMNIGVLVELALLAFIIYFPYSQGFFGTARLSPKYWSVSLLSLILLTAWAETRKAYARRHPQSLFARTFAW
jgi:sodium/potassium-transporting ATPase subunit alpha